MKKYLLTSLFALSLCSTSFSQAQPKEPITEKAPQIAARILLTTPKSMFEGGEDIRLEITLENTGQKSLYFHDRKLENFYEIEVIGPLDKPVSSFIEPPMGFYSQGITVPPQSKKKGHIWLNRAFPLYAPGPYTVKLSKKSYQQGEVFTVTSQPLLFWIRSKPTLGYWDED